MSATNTWWLGRHNPTRFSLSAGNSDYRQNFIALADEASERGIDRLHILYPLVSEKEVQAYVPFASLVEPGDDLEPGWYAVNLRVEQYVPAILEGSDEAIYQHASLLSLAEQWLPLWRTVATGEDKATSRARSTSTDGRADEGVVILPGRMRIAASLIVTAAALCGCGGSTESTRRRDIDIVLVSVDTLRADYLGYAGRRSADTPTFDRLARDGTNFVNAFTPMTRTTPALASLLTGLWPKHHGSQEVGQPMERGVTLAEILTTNGYHAAAVSANLAASPSHNLAGGFHAFVGSQAIKSAHGERMYRHGTKAPPDAVGWAGATTEQALALAAEAPRDQPLFLWVHYFDPHLVYRPPSPWHEEVEAPLCWELYDEFAVRRPQDAWRVFGDFDGIASRALEDCQALYDAEIAYTDRAIGALLAGLEDRGRDQLVIVTSDHGENFGEGGSFFEHGDNAKDAASAVPLLFFGKGVASGRVDEGSVSLVDIAPTVLEWLSLSLSSSPQTPMMDGESLAVRIAETGTPHDASDPRVVFAESASALRNQSFETLLTGRAFERACINGERFTLCDVYANEKRAPALYDHRDDPGLTHDVAARFPEEVARLEQARERWPPESARFRTAIRGRFKLVQTPRLEGGYRASLHDRSNDPTEELDVRERHPEIARSLLEHLEAWAASTEYAPSLPDPEITRGLRELGYIQ